MAGTTVRDNDEVLYCFRKACLDTGLLVSDDQLNALMGVSKNVVFQMLWEAQLGKQDIAIPARAAASYGHFKVILEEYYRSHPCQPTEGCLDTFIWCRNNGIKIALNTGFYRGVTDLILQNLDWQIGRDVDFVIASDEVPEGRPAVFMIAAAMKHFGITDPTSVVKVGDTPVDIAEGRNAGCRFVVSLTNGTHRHDQLAPLQPDVLLEHIGLLPEWLSAQETKK